MRDPFEMRDLRHFSKISRHFILLSLIVAPSIDSRTSPSFQRQRANPSDFPASTPPLPCRSAGKLLESRQHSGGEGTPKNLCAVCTNCNEGLQNTALPKPDRVHLLSQIRRAIIDDQEAVGRDRTRSAQFPPTGRSANPPHAAPFQCSMLDVRCSHSPNHSSLYPLKKPARY